MNYASGTTSLPGVTAPASTTPPPANTAAAVPDATGKTQADYAASIANDPAKLAAFLKFKNGTTVNADQTALNTADTSAANANTAAQTEFANQQKALASEQGRYGLLQSYLGQPNNYSQGAQRLDQTFLQTDKNNSLGNLNATVNGTQANNFSSIANQIAALQAASTAATGTENSLATDIGKAASGANTAYTGTLQSDVNTAQAKQATDIKYFNDQVAALQGKAPAGVTIDPNFLAKVGLQSGERTWGAIDPTVQNTFGTATAQQLNIANTATPEQIARLNALSQLNNGTVDANGNVINATPAMTQQAAVEAIKYNNLDPAVQAAKEKAMEILSGARIIGEGQAGGANEGGYASQGNSFLNTLTGNREGETFWNASNNKQNMNTSGYVLDPVSGQIVDTTTGLPAKGAAPGLLGNISGGATNATLNGLNPAMVGKGLLNGVPTTMNGLPGAISKGYQDMYGLMGSSTNAISNGLNSAIGDINHKGVSQDVWTAAENNAAANAKDVANKLLSQLGYGQQIGSSGITNNMSLDDIIKALSPSSNPSQRYAGK